MLVIAGIATNGFSDSDADCLFDLSTKALCVYGEYQVSVKSKPFEADFVQLASLEVYYKGKKYWLKIVPDTLLTQGDKGIISFDDINFDGVADIAVSTSFSITNQYMDYWLSEPEQKGFIYVGNFCRFKLDPAKKILRNKIQLNAAEYVDNVYTWQGKKLIKCH